MNTADRIQSLRKTKGISQEELAEKIGVSRQAVSKWESDQSLPDIDKIIALSDFFEVTTDYILKGTESLTAVTYTEVKRTGNAKKKDAYIAMVVSPFIIYIGVLSSIVLWYARQTPEVIIPGIICILCGCMSFAYSYVTANHNKEKALRMFWTTSIWPLAFIPLSVVYNAVFSRVIAPYPLLAEPPIAFAAFWVVYLAVCGAVFIKFRRRKVE